MSVLDPYSEAVISSTVEAALKPVFQAADRVLSPAADLVGDRLKAWLSERIQLLKSDALRKIAKSGRSARNVSPKIAVRVAEGYVLEDDAWLCEYWSGLLASAAIQPDSVLPSFPDILRGVAPDDAKLLDVLYDSSFPTPKEEQAFVTKSFYGPQIRNLFVKSVMNLSEATPDTDEIFERVATSCQNLMRLRLITEEQKKGVSLTILGYKLVRACRGPGPEERHVSDVPMR